MCAVFLLCFLAGLEIGGWWLVVGEALYVGLTDKGTPDMQGVVVGVTDALDIIA